MINRFDGKYFFLSNYSASPFKDECGDFFPTMEHYFQAQKATNMYDFVRSETSFKSLKDKDIFNPISYLFKEVYGLDWEKQK